MKLASLSRSFSSDSRRSLNWSPSIGYRPQNTIGLGSWYPASGSAAGRAASVTVSPERASATSLMPAMRYPVSPGPSDPTGVLSGVRTPTSSASWTAPACRNRSRLPVLSVPLTTRTDDTTPR